MDPSLPIGTAIVLSKEAMLIGHEGAGPLTITTGNAAHALQLPIVSGMLLASSIVAANYVPANDNATVIAILSLAFFGQGMTNLGWTVISDVAPKKLIGLTGGIFNFSANLAGIITPIVIGVFYGMTGSFFGPLVYIAIVALIGAFSYSVVLGDIHRLDVDTDDAAGYGESAFRRTG